MGQGVGAHWAILETSVRQACTAAAPDSSSMRPKGSFKRIQVSFLDLRKDPGILQKDPGIGLVSGAPSGYLKAVWLKSFGPVLRSFRPKIDPGTLVDHLET